MAKFSDLASHDMQYEDTLKLRDQVSSLLQEEGVEDAGVGLTYDRDAQSWGLAIHLESPLPSHLSGKLKSSLSGTAVRIEQVGATIPYSSL